MRRMRKVAAVFVLLLAFECVCFAQELDKVVDELTEGLSGEMDTGQEGEELVSHLQRLQKHPVNINSASRAQLQSMQILTPFQIESILSRVESSGAILSFAELSLLYGFDENTVQKLRPYIELGPAERKRRGFLKDQSTSIYARYQRSFGPDAESHLVRTRFSYLDKVEASMVYKGNSTASSSASLSTFSVSYSALRLGREAQARIVAGDFYARFGQGLASWNGFSFSMAAESSGFVKNADPVSLYTSSDTSRLLRGGAVSFSWNGLEISGGYSFRGNVSLARISYLRKRVRAGLSFCGKRQEANVYSADLLVGGARVVCFAEAAYCFLPPAGDEAFRGASAVIGGFSADMGNASLHILLRSYQKDFQTPYGGAYSSISKTANQQGASLRITVPVYRKLNLAAGIDYTAYPSPRYHVKDPSSSLKVYLKLSLDDSGFGTPARNQLWVKGYYRQDVRYSTPLQSTCSFSLKGGGTLYIAEFLSAGIRAEYNTLDGKALSLSLKAGRGRFTLSAGATGFDVPRWDGRIYFPQAELPYSFSSTLLYGKGVDAYALVKTRLSRRLSLYLKYQYNRGKSILKGAVSAEF